MWWYVEMGVEFIDNLSTKLKKKTKISLTNYIIFTRFIFSRDFADDIYLQDRKKQSLFVKLKKKKKSL